MDKKIKFEIINHVGKVGIKGEWSKELNIISWNGNEPKYDIRDWNNDYSKMGKGITLTEEEMKVLSRILLDEISIIEND